MYDGGCGWFRFCTPPPWAPQAPLEDEDEYEYPEVVGVVVVIGDCTAGVVGWDAAEPVAGGMAEDDEEE